MKTVLCLVVFLSSVGVTLAANHRLVDAIKNRDREAVTRLLEQKVDVNVPQADGATALHWAVHWDDLDLVRSLVRAGARVDVPNELGVTPLMLACTSGNGAIVDVLLNAGANANGALRTGETALMLAARTGSVKAVRALLTHGANVNAKDPVQEQTVLMWAAAHNRPEIIRLLVISGADVDTKTKTHGSTPLMFAAREGAAEAVRTLLALGAKIDATAADGSTPLLIAVVMGHWELATSLLDEGADPNTDHAGYTPLHWASGAWEGEVSGRYGSEKYLWMAGLGSGKRELVESLLKHGANPNARIKKAPAFFSGTVGPSGHVNLVGATPFLLAAQAAQITIMRVLLTHGADSRMMTADNTTALMAAAGYGRSQASRALESDAINAVELALQLGGNVNHVNDRGETALHGAAYVGWNAMIRFLVDRGAIINHENKRGWTALTIASGYVDQTTGPNPVFLPETAALLRQLGGISKFTSYPVDGR